MSRRNIPAQYRTTEPYDGPVMTATRSMAMVDAMNTIHENRDVWGLNARHRKDRECTEGKVKSLNREPGSFPGTRCANFSGKEGGRDRRLELESVRGDYEPTIHDKYPERSLRPGSILPAKYMYEGSDALHTRARRELGDGVPRAREAFVTTGPEPVKTEPSITVKEVEDGYRRLAELVYGPRR